MKLGKKILIGLSSVSALSLPVMLMASSSANNPYLKQEDYSYEREGVFSQEKILSKVKSRINNNNNDKNNLYQLDWFLNPQGKLLIERLIDGGNGNLPDNDFIWKKESVSRYSPRQTINSSYLDESKNKFNNETKAEQIDFNLNNFSVFASKIDNLNLYFDNNKNLEDNKNSRAIFLDEKGFIKYAAKWDYEFKEINDKTKEEKSKIESFYKNTKEVSFKGKKYLLKNSRDIINAEFIGRDSFVNTIDETPDKERDINISTYFKDSQQSKKYATNLFILGIKNEFIREIYNPKYSMFSYNTITDDEGNEWTSRGQSKVPDWYASNGGHQYVYGKNYIKVLLLLNKYIVDKNITSGKLKDILNSSGFRSFVNEKKYDKKIETHDYYSAEKEINVYYESWNSDMENLFYNPELELSRLWTKEVKIFRNYKNEYAEEKYFLPNNLSKETRKLDTKEIDLKYKSSLFNNNKVDENGLPIKFENWEADLISERKISYKNLFVLDGNNTDDSFDGGAVYKSKQPKMSFGLNIPLVNALYNKNYLVDFYKKMNIYLVDRNDFENSRHLKNAFSRDWQNYKKYWNDFIQKGMSGKYSLSQLRNVLSFFEVLKKQPEKVSLEHIDNLKRGVKVNINNIYLDANIYKFEEKADWVKLLETNKYFIPDFDEAKLDEIIENNYSDADSTDANVVINDYNYDYQFMLPTLLNNDVFAMVKNTNDASFEKVKIYDGIKKEFLPIYADAKDESNFDSSVDKPNTNARIEISELLIENKNQSLGNNYFGSDKKIINGQEFLRVEMGNIENNTIKNSTKIQNSSIEKIDEEKIRELFNSQKAVRFINNKLVFMSQYSPRAINLGINKDNLVARREIEKNRNSKNKSIFNSFIYIPDKVQSIQEQEYASWYYERGIRPTHQDHLKYMRLVRATLGTPMENNDDPRFKFDPKNITKVFDNIEAPAKNLIHGNLQPIPLSKMESMFRVEDRDAVLTAENAKDIGNSLDYPIQQAIIREGLTFNQMLPDDYAGSWWVITSFSDVIDRSKFKVEDGYLYLRERRDERTGEFLAHDYLVKVQTHKVKVRANKDLAVNLDEFLAKENVRIRNGKDAQNVANKVVNNKEIFETLFWGEFKNKINLNGIKVVDEINFNKEEIVEKYLFSSLGFYQEIEKSLLHGKAARTEWFKLGKGADPEKEKERLDKEKHFKELIYSYLYGWYEGYYSPMEVANIIELVKKIENDRISKEEYNNLWERIHKDETRAIRYEELMIPPFKKLEKNQWFLTMEEMGYNPSANLGSVVYDEGFKKYFEDRKKQELTEDEEAAPIENRMARVALSNSLRNVSQEFNITEKSEYGFIEVGFDDLYNIGSAKDLKLNIKNAISEMKLPASWVFKTEDNKLYIPVNSLVKKTIYLKAPIIKWEKNKDKLDAKNVFEISEKFNALSINEKVAFFEIKAEDESDDISGAFKNIKFSPENASKIKIDFELNDNFEFVSSFPGALALEFEVVKDEASGEEIINTDKPSITEEKGGFITKEKVWSWWHWFLIIAIPGIIIIFLISMLIMRRKWNNLLAKNKKTKRKNRRKNRQEELKDE